MSDPSVGFDPKAIPAEIKRWKWARFCRSGIGHRRPTYVLLLLGPVFRFHLDAVLAPRAVPGLGATDAGTASSISSACSASGRSGAPLSGLAWWRCSAGSGGVFYGLKHSAAYEMAVAKLETSPIATKSSAAQSRQARHSATSPSTARRKGGAQFLSTGPKGAGVVYVTRSRKTGLVDHEARAELKGEAAD